jgi:ComF family protein
MADPPRHTGIAAATLYNDTSRQLVLRFKHGGRISLAAMMARQMLARLGELAEGSVLVPVPLHRWRLWKRGYNQAALLAQQIGSLAQREVCVDALCRIRQTPSLGGLGRKARERALSGAIEANPARMGAITKVPVILVDDVLTSGATTEACTRVLLRAGAASVRIACFARVLGEALPPQSHWPESETPEAARTSGAT